MEFAVQEIFRARVEIHKVLSAKEKYPLVALRVCTRFYAASLIADVETGFRETPNKSSPVFSCEATTMCFSICLKNSNRDSNGFTFQ